MVKKPQPQRMVQVKISDLIQASWNPPGRTEKGKLRRLMDSIGERGQQFSPILIKRDLSVVDGHRRLNAMYLLGYTHVNAVYVDDSYSTAEVFCDVNTTGKPINNVDKLGIWLQKPTAVGPTFNRNAQRWADLMGKDFLKKINSNPGGRRFGLDLFSTVKYIASYVGERDNDDFIQTAARWVFKFAMSNKVRSYIQSKQSPEALLKTIRKNSRILP